MTEPRAVHPSDYSRQIRVTGAALLSMFFVLSIFLDFRVRRIHESYVQFQGTHDAYAQIDGLCEYYNGRQSS